MKAIITKRAGRAAERLATRWERQGDDPKLFAREFLEVVIRLETTHSPGSSCPTKAPPALKRILLPKSYCRVYFWINERKQQIEIINIWDARRQRPPKL